MNGTSGFEKDKLLPIKSNTAYQQRRAHTISQVELNTMIETNIKNNRNNPFWVPQKNYELFKVKDIIKEEKALYRKKKGLAEPHHKSNINTFTHRQNLMETFNNTHAPTKAGFTANGTAQGTDGFYLTEARFDPSSTTTVLKMLTGTKTKLVDKVNEDDIKRNQKIQEKTNTLCYKNDHSVKNFIHKTKDIILMKYSTKVKQERVVRLCETFDNEVEQYKDKIYSLEQSKGLFKTDFFNKYEIYVKQLRDQRDKEKNDINKLLDEKQFLDSKVRRLENQISKNKEKIEQFSEYRKFMIQVKEHKMSSSSTLISLATIEQQEKNLPQTLLQKSISNIVKNRKSKLGKSTDRNQEKKPNLETITIDKESKVSLTSNYDEPIFEKSSDLMEELRKLEQENLTCLSKFNYALDNVNLADMELEKYIKKESEENSHTQNEIKKKEAEYKRAKNKNDLLQAEINFLSRENTIMVGGEVKKDPELVIKQENAKILLSKVHKLYNTCFKFYTKDHNKDNTDEFVAMYNTIIKAADISVHQMDMLRFIEKAFQLINNKCLEFRITKESRLIEFEKKLDKERKYKYSLAMKNVVVDKIKVLEEKLKKKEDNRRFPIRKVQTRLKPIQKHKKASSQALKQNSQTLDDFLHELV